MKQYSHRRNRLWLILPCSLLAISCATQPQEMAYVERLGNDTLAVEVITRTAGRIEGRVLTRNPVTRVASYVATLSPDGRITRLEVGWSVPLENSHRLPQNYVVMMEGDSAAIERRRGQRTDTLRLAVPERTIPSLGKAPAAVFVWEQAVRWAMGSGRDSTAFAVLGGLRLRPQANAIVKRGSDSVSLSFFGRPMYASFDRKGRILGISGRATTLQIETERVSSMDFDALAADFAARDARGEGLGVPSPRAELETAGGGATFDVVYSRPAKRGREIWGGLVPYDTIWRTGANAATMFTTDRDLVIAGAVVPAGAYTLWSTFTADTDTLVINSQTGQWGTAYDPSQDFVRLPMERDELAESVERFTIAIEPRDEGGVLSLTWDTRKLWIEMEMQR